MKKLFLLLGVALSAFAFTSCDDNDGYSLNNYWVDIATVEKVSDNSPAYFLVLDNGEKLWPAANNFPFYNPANGQRLVVNFTLLSDGNANYDHDIKINDLTKVLTKPTVELTSENADSIGNNGIVIKDVWVGSNYINIIFDFKGDNQRHMVNVVESAIFGSTTDLTKLEFRHNSYGDSERYWYRGIASFDISSLKQDGKTSINIELSAKGYNNDVHTYSLVYDWSTTAKVAKKSFPTQVELTEVK